MEKIESFDQVIEINKKIGGTPYPFFRGQANKDWPLKPSIVRNRNNNIKELEIDILKDFSLFSENSKLNLIQQHPSDNFIYGRTWNLILQGQHLGLPTRVIDWTLDIFTALFFAICDKKEMSNAGMLYILYFEKSLFYDTEKIRESGLFKSNPLDFEDTIIINQALTSTENQKQGEKRMEKQYGRFLFQPISKIELPFERNCRELSSSFNLRYLEIPSSAKKQLLKDLDAKKNINSENLVLVPNIEALKVVNKVREKHGFSILKY